MKQVLVLQHAAPEHLGTIADALKTAGVGYTYLRTYEEAPVPKDIEPYAGLIVMGGPQSVYEQDKFPYLTQEMRLIERTLQKKKPILGVCLGSQLLAATLGAPVTKGRTKEIGWFPVTLKEAAKTDPLFQDLPSPFTPLHWHGDIFELPKGAVSLASSELTEHQAFRYGPNAYGLLFHLEITQEMVSEWIEVFEGELKKEGLDGPAILWKVSESFSYAHQTGEGIYSRWASLLTDVSLPQ